ncbi:hypothetical protein MNBD_NITROSPINAE04-2043 [hydrothermal vent metagenome]|uniref:Radical SAM core domain-containing protein n=1 Tax=hydrothermal vent metagenome TaxID=652676 RepID=A0A3B1CG71_9ZZZZ
MFLVNHMNKKLAKFALNFRYSFRPGKPVLIWRLVKIVLKSWFVKYKGLRYVDFSLDFACNLKCEHCFATALEDNDGARPKMTVKDYARVAEQSMELGAVNFSFQGGETLMVKNLEEIISACKPWRNVISVTTNGTLLTKERAIKLRRLGVDIVTISLDSSIASEHDKFRGGEAGVFDKAMRAIRNALDAGLNVTLGSVVTHDSLYSEGINGLFDLAKKLKIILVLIMPVPAGNWAGDKKILLTKDDLDYVKNLTESTPYIRTDFQSNFGDYGCGAAKEILYLTPYGDTLTCPFLHIGFGNVLAEPVSVIRDRALALPQFAGYHQKCLASTDEEFIEKYLSKTFHAEKSPMPWDEVFRDSPTSSKSPAGAKIKKSEVQTGL